MTFTLDGTMAGLEPGLSTSGVELNTSCAVLCPVRQLPSLELMWLVRRDKAYLRSILKRLARIIDQRGRPLGQPASAGIVGSARGLIPGRRRDSECLHE